MNTTAFLPELSSALADLVDRAAKLVVAVDARPRRAGSGIIIGPELVVTADHVLERDEVEVRLDGRRLAATISGRDPAADIAVLRVPGLDGNALQAGTEPRVGQLVVSVSRTSSGGVSCGAGVINAIGGPLRTGRGVTLRRVIRTDAAARPGTSGGAIVDAAGSVIAMMTSALLRGLPVGIPIDQLLEMATPLASNRQPRRAYLGVSVQPVRFPKAGPDGVDSGLLVSGIARDGAADRSGLMIGDVIVGFDRSRLTHADDLQDRLALAEAGSRATLELVRGGTLQTLDVTLGARPSA